MTGRMPYFLSRQSGPGSARRGLRRHRRSDLVGPRPAQTRSRRAGLQDRAARERRDGRHFPALRPQEQTVPVPDRHRGRPALARSRRALQRLDRDALTSDRAGHSGSVPHRPRGDVRGAVRDPDARGRGLHQLVRRRGRLPQRRDVPARQLNLINLL